MSYLIIKSLHLIGVVTWFAGLFYIFRLYVYHTENQQQPEITKILEVMERRLYYGITWPAMLLTLLMGLWLLYKNPSTLSQTWFHIKVLMLLVLFGYHFFSGYVRKQFLHKNFFLSSKQCRLINEVPTVVLLVVIPLAVIKSL